MTSAGTWQRQATYPERKRTPWRLSARLRARVARAAEHDVVPITLYVNKVLEIAVRSPPDASRLAEYDDQSGGSKATITLRMLPMLHAKVVKAATRAGVSVNKYICFVVHEATP